MGIPLGHKLKIVKRIKELREAEGLSVPASAQSTRSKIEEIKYEDGMSTRPATQVQYEELPGPTEPSTIMTEDIHSNNISKKKHVSFKDVPDSNVGMPATLKEGAYNEEESHNGFLEALNAWRNAGKTPEEITKPDKKVKPKDIEASWR